MSYMTTKPIRADINSFDHAKLKAKLALENMSIVDWIRLMVKQELEKLNDKTT